MGAAATTSRTAIRQVGGTLGVAVLGSILNSAYRSGLELDGVAARASDQLALPRRARPARTEASTSEKSATAA